MIKLNLTKPYNMKKALTTTFIIFKVIATYILVVIDRFSMALFMGVDLPTIKKKAFVVDETTTDEQIGQSVIDEENHERMYSKEYLPKARRRTRNVIILATWIYLFAVLSWTQLLIIAAVFALTIGIIILWKYIKRRKTKISDEN